MTTRKTINSVVGPGSPRNPLLMDRRAMMQQAAFLSAAVAVPGCFAEELTQGPVRTASMVEGPFYPDQLPLDTDNDLLLINDSINPGVGEVTYLSGRVTGKNGKPIRNAFVEIWQWRCGWGVLARWLKQQGQVGCQFPGVRTVLDGPPRTLLLSHDQTGSLPGTHPPHSLWGQQKWTSRFDHPNAGQGTSHESGRFPVQANHQPGCQRFTAGWIQPDQGIQDWRVGSEFRYRTRRNGAGT